MTPTVPRQTEKARVLCRFCGFVFGAFGHDRRFVKLTPGVHLVVDHPLYVDLICPQCGQRRRMTDVTFTAMAVPELPTTRHAKIAINNQ